jgi:glycine/D-amino acid oxidase-like deaminating enzyme
MQSVWEKNSLIGYDAIVVGAGLTGLWTAFSLKTFKPHLRVLVLESGLLPQGASTKNAGFACFGSASEILSDMARMGEGQALDLVEKRWRGLVRIHKEFSNETIDFQRVGGYEVGGEELESTVEQLARLNALLKPIFKQTVFKLENQKLNSFGLKKYTHLIGNQFEGHLDSGKLLDSLWTRVCQMGIRVITGCRVKEIGHQVIHGEGIEFRAPLIFLCTNGYASELNPDSGVNPGRGMVLVTKPLDRVPFKGTFHIDSGYYYFRDLGNRVLLGGGRNLDFDTENTTELGINPIIYKDLQSKMRDYLLPDRPFEVEYLWAGIMGFGKTKYPNIGFQGSYYQAIGMGGMGVALSGWAAAELVRLALRS